MTNKAALTTSSTPPVPPVDDGTLSRAVWEGIELVAGPLYVVGHTNPDTDSVCSALAYAELLRRYGLDAQARVAGPPNRETTALLQYACVPEPPVLRDAAGKNIALVDHSDYAQAVRGMRAAHVVAVVDHHGCGSLATEHPLIYEARPVGATATLVWRAYERAGEQLEASTALLLLGAVLSDTANLTKRTTTTMDGLACTCLAAHAKIADVDALFERMYAAKVSHEGMSEEQIYQADYKSYEAADVTYGIGCVEVTGEDEAHAMARTMSSYLRRVPRTAAARLLFAEVKVHRPHCDMTLVVPGGEAELELAQRAFGPEVPHDGTSLVFRPSVSRKKDVVPALRRALEGSRIAVP